MRSRCSRRGRSGVPAIVVPPSRRRSHRRRGQRPRARHRRLGRGGAGRAGAAGRAVAAELVAGGLTIVGVTGSSGKTSTKDLLAAVLAPLGEVVAPPGSFNNELGHPWTVLRATRIHRLPDPGDVRPAPRQHRRAGRDRAAVDRGRAQRRHRTPRRVRLPRGHRGNESRTAPSGSVIRCGDPQRRRHRGGRDGRGDRGAGGAGQPAPGRADVWAGPVTLDELARPRFTLHAGDADRPTSRWPCTATIRCPTRCARPPSRSNAARAREQVAAALAAAGPVSRHRMQVTTRDDGVTVINDAYNANPDSMRAGLQGAGLDGARAADGSRSGAAGRCWARWPSSATTRYPSMTASVDWPCD